MKEAATPKQELSNIRCEPQGDEPWRQPCSTEGNNRDSSLVDSDLVDYLLLQGNMALHQVNSYKDDMCRLLFNQSFADMYDIDKGNDYCEWILDRTTLPKHAGQHLSDDFYQSLNWGQFGDMLINNYHVLQRVAVFVEQITFEKVLNDPTLQSKYEATQEENQKTLCALLVSMDAMDLTPKPDAGRNVMPEELRHLPDQSQRDFRNFRIIKLYVNMLEYYTDGLSYYKRRQPFLQAAISHL